MTAAAALAMTVLHAPAAANSAAGPHRYLDPVFAVSEATTVTYATEPNLVSGEPVELQLDYVTPDEGPTTGRPAIVWVHGGGFRTGTREVLAGVVDAWAARGYVALTISYRLDPGNRCQDVQDGRVDPVAYAAQGERCATAIAAAQHDAQGAVRWVRANAEMLGVDPERIAIGGFSAGAVTAVNVAQRADDPGVSGDHDEVDPRVRAALVASGCNYQPETIGSGDAPISLLASGGDRAVPFDCVVATADRSEAAGLAVQRIFYPDEDLHARKLYYAHQADVDEQWPEFLAEHLDLR